MIYEYRCRQCGHEFEVEQRITAERLADCPRCGANTDYRLISNTSFALKGDGWASDGYSKAGG